MADVARTVWDDRWDALYRHLGMLLGDASSAEIAVSRRAVFVPLIEALRDFGDHHFHFFNQFFHNSPFISSDNFPPEYVIRQVISRVAEDAEVIQTCLEQRLPGRSDPDAQAVLLKADKLAWAALQFAIKRGLMPEGTTAITYFQKVPSVRVIPYASVALIGIPITCLDASVDFLAIPHEVGHYVFWNSNLFDPAIPPRPTIQARLLLQMKPDDYWIKRWAQEIFADTYGALVARAAIACSFQDLEYESAKEDIVSDDGKHPAPIVRPEIYIDAIQRDVPTLGDVPTLVNSLTARWNGLVDDRHSLIRKDSQGKWAYLKTHRDADSTDILLPSEVTQNYQSVVTKITAILAENKPETEAFFPARDATDLIRIYSIFETALNDFAASTDDAIIDTTIVTQTWDKWTQRFKAPEDATKIKVAEWNPLFVAGGWTTEGPQGRPLIDP